MTSFRLIPEPAGATVWSQFREIFATPLEMVNKRKLSTVRNFNCSLSNIPRYAFFSLDNNANSIPIYLVAISMPYSEVGTNRLMMEVRARRSGSTS
jgi:hypothetical protein